MINLDFADFKTIMTKGEVAIVGMGQSDAPDRAEVAATQALNHMMLDVDYHGSNGALIHVTGGPDMTLGEAVRAAETITDKMSDDSMVIWGSRIDPDLGKQMRVTLVLTGIDSPRLVGGDYLDDLKLYNMDPNTGQEKNVDLGIELFDIESSWK
jgi:cell division protein FtsZ